MALGFAILGLGFVVLGLEFAVSMLGSTVYRLGFAVSGLGFAVSGPGFVDCEPGCAFSALRSAASGLGLGFEVSARLFLCMCVWQTGCYIFMRTVSP